ncbi:AAA family ATPase [Ktedonobacteria bacterium brp13]|nr:AAA family ATPase [Ktedonobacteria bacterium brp13]
MITQTLPEIVQKFLADHHYIEERMRTTAEREQTLPAIQTALHDFIQGKINFVQLNAVLNQAKNRWYAGRHNTPGHPNIELTKFAKYHVESNNEANEQFRALLQNLNARTIGQKIEQCYAFLLQERDRLRHAGLSSGTIVAPRSSAFLISLIAHWLDPEGEFIICTEYVRISMAVLVREGLIPNSTDFKPSGDAFIIRTSAQYDAFLSFFDAISNAAPQITSLPYWREFFLWWFMDHRQELIISDAILIKDNDNAEFLSAPLTKVRKIADEQAQYTTLPHVNANQPTDLTPAEIALLIPHEQLKPTPEPLLTRLIHEVQRHILVDETVIRRIYHALLAGHVILTGPPGTGKTELARIIPEVLWRSEKAQSEPAASLESETEASELTTETAFTTRLVTATDDWTPRTLISGIVPQSENGSIHYKIQFGHLTATIQKNWSFQGKNPAEWSHITLRRTRLQTSGSMDRSSIQTFKGQWLVIDEFNRAPIDLALGDALTALGGNDVLRVGIESGSAELPIPLDFRIIGTLNSFDRHYLNQISEALKRRFSFVEILPPTRQQREDEQGIVLYKALKKVMHLTSTLTVEEDILYWENTIAISVEASGHYSMLWEDEQDPFHSAFAAAWNIFEVIRIYRQLGTAQAISLVRHMLIAGLLQNYSTQEQWITQALDAALCDTIADQLQVLLPDEIETLLLYLTTEHSSFNNAYSRLLTRLTSTPQSLYRQLLALASVQNEAGQPFISDTQVEELATQDRPEIAAAILSDLFHLQSPAYQLPQFTRRLRTFKAERGL